VEAKSGLSLWRKSTDRLTVLENVALCGNRTSKRRWNKRWKELHYEASSFIFFAWNNINVIKFREIRWADHVARMWRWEIYTEFWLKSERKRATRRPWRRWKCNIKIDLNPSKAEFFLNNIVTCRPISRQRPKYADATIEPEPQEAFPMWFAYIYIYIAR
jgi:hypothetical protein